MVLFKAIRNLYFAGKRKFLHFKIEKFNKFFFYSGLDGLTLFVGLQYFCFIVDDDCACSNKKRNRTEFMHGRDAV